MSWQSNLFARLFYNISSGNRTSRILGWLALKRLPRAVLNSAIRSYCHAFRVELNEVEVPRDGFRTFDEFFTRKLLPGARIVDPSPDMLVSPCDGVVQSVGQVSNGMLFQAKGREYPLEELVGDADVARRLERGKYITIYLSPRDYHRVHFPCDSDVVACRYIPGRLFTVAPRAAGVIERLFVKNERISTYLMTPFGEAVLVMVGASGVGRITLSYGGYESNVGLKGGATYFSPPVRCKKGDEFGMFHIGSTVILIIEPPGGEFLVTEGNVVRMGQAIIRISSKQ